jgi:hypothetical protein
MNSKLEKCALVVLLPFLYALILLLWIPAVPYLVLMIHILGLEPRVNFFDRHRCAPYR